MLGAIIGAGFLSGAEPVDFFGTENILPSVIFGTAVMAVALTGCFYCFKKLQNKGCGVEKLFGSTRAYSVAVVTAGFVFTASMLAGLDALWNSFNFLNGVPVLSTITVILICTFSAYGVKGLEKFNLVLMPMIIIGVNLLIFGRFELNVGKIKMLLPKNVLYILLYVFLNLFISVPVMKECAKNKGGKTLVFASITVALLIGLQLAIILCALNGGVFTNVEMPLFVAITASGFSTTYYLGLLFGSVTSAFSAYFPVYEFARKKGGRYGIAISGIAVMIISRLGLNKIVKYLYPLIAIFGLIYFISLLCSIKNKHYADNKNIQKVRRRKICQERKRTKTKLLNLQTKNTMRI